MTSLREDVVLFKCKTLRPRVLLIRPHDKIAVEDVKLLATAPSDGSTQSPYNRKQEQALQPHAYLLARHALCVTGS